MLRSIVGSVNATDGVMSALLASLRAFETPGSFQQPLALSWILQCVNNVYQAWRLAMLEGTLHPDAWPGLEAYKKLLERRPATFEDAVERMALDLLSQCGRAPQVGVPNVPGRGAGAAAAPTPVNNAPTGGAGVAAGPTPVDYGPGRGAGMAAGGIAGQ